MIQLASVDVQICLIDNLRLCNLDLTCHKNAIFRFTKNNSKCVFESVFTSYSLSNMSHCLFVRNVAIHCLIVLKKKKLLTFFFLLVECIYHSEVTMLSIK